ncbi:MAG TPA: 16S rRNA (uracil(1498)-N(3))-methyltransferase [Galbitalea sp.]|jgi:16S rRNA (uracil1498-N3)-methyltransferase|nr:16S rRNA (uracil(1498)-N(3))-methyltransferase [Galbitalea sp.]
MAHQYLSEDLGEPEMGTVAVVAGPEARHAVTVSRLAVGEQVQVGNGAGLVATGTVTDAAAAEFRFRVESVETHARPQPAIWLAQALAKGDRDELAIQAATELGVDGVIPWSAARSVARWEGPKIAKGRERWAAVVREATKQSARAWLPEISPLVTTKQLARLAEDAVLVVLDPAASQSITSAAATLPEGRDIVLVTGPEGGIAPGELELLYGAGAIGARLGTGILRTSTAGPAAIAVLSATLGRW